MRKDIGFVVALWSVAWFLHPPGQWLTQDGAWTLSSAWATLNRYALSDPVAQFRQPGLYGWIMAPLVALSGGKSEWMAFILHLFMLPVLLGLQKKWTSLSRFLSWPLLMAVAFHPVWLDQRPEWLGAIAVYMFFQSSKFNPTHPQRIFWMMVCTLIHPVSFLVTQWALWTGLAGKRPHWHWMVIPWSVVALAWIGAWAADAHPEALLISLWQRWENFAPAQAVRYWLDSLPFLLMTILTFPIWARRPKVLRGYLTLFLLLLIPGKSYYLIYADVWILARGWDSGWMVARPQPHRILVLIASGLICVWVSRPVAERWLNRDHPPVEVPICAAQTTWVPPMAGFDVYHVNKVKLYYSNPFDQNIQFYREVVPEEEVLLREPWQIRAWMKSGKLFTLDTLTPVVYHPRLSWIEGLRYDTVQWIRAHVWATGKGRAPLPPLPFEKK